MSASLPIRIVAVFDPLNYAIAQQAIIRGVLRYGFGAALGMYAATEGYAYHRSGEFNWLGAAGMALFLVLCFFFCTNRRFLAWQLRRSYVHVPAESLNTTWEIDAAGLRYASIANSGSMDWSSILKTVRIPEGFLVLPVSNIANWLPNGGFESDAARESFAELARTKSRTYLDRSGSYIPFV